MATLQDFFSENDVRIGEGKDFTVTPPVYYSSLINGFTYYFRTYYDRKIRYNFLDDPDRWTKKAIAFDLTGHDDNIVFTILGFHRFMELMLKDILRSINPFLAVRLPEAEADLYDFHEGLINAEDLRTVEYADTMKRFRHALTRYEKDSTIYIDILQKYEFLNEKHNQDILKFLHVWRNRIMHNGSALPNFFAFEYLMTQGVIPIVTQILSVESNKNGKFLDVFTTKTGIDLLDEFNAIKFGPDDFTNKQQDVGKKLKNIGHLKELGRAVFHHELAVFGHEGHYERLSTMSERIAIEEGQHAPGAQRVISCPCCGISSLVVYEKKIESPWRRETLLLQWCECMNCNYTMRNDIGDPFDFGISKSKIFA